MTGYVELQVTSNFSFLRGAAHPDELVRMAHALGLSAMGICDRNTLAGVVRAHIAARELGIKLLVGAHLDLADAPGLICYPTDRAAYGRLCRLLTLGQRRAEKGKCILTLADVAKHAEGQIFIIVPPFRRPDKAFAEKVRNIRLCLDGSLYLAASNLYRGDDRSRIAELDDLARRQNLRLVATNDVHTHHKSRRMLQDVLTCIREGCTIESAGFRLYANAERHLKAPEEMAQLFRGFEHALVAGLEIADACHFSLDELRYEYPDEPVGAGETPQSQLEKLVWQGAQKRFPDGVPEKIRATIDAELALVDELDYAPYFLTVHDIVSFARSRGILCQGRGSAANSVVCYCLHITAVDPTEVDLLFERFISAERNEPPDIDVDFEHERREEVIQYIYARYGRMRAGLAATVISYRGRSAVREVGKAMGLSEDVIAALSGTVWGSYGNGVAEDQVREAGFNPADPVIQKTLELTAELIGFPRHLSQHVGGFVLTRGPLCELIPIGNAAMDDRTVVEWDKDDLDALGILKIDVLGLGMLTCIRKCFDLLRDHFGINHTLASLPREDPAVYDMLCRADSLGVFQVESRAQMNMLPRLKPRCFYDLVIEVAIVRPGPIQGDMVHPYLRRRDGAEPVEFPSPAPEFGPPDELAQVLGKTLGVPLFQEQAMRIAIVAAGFTPSEADRLRRAMATFRRVGTINSFRDKLVEGMAARGYEREFAERCFKQIEGFGEYGFPESHAASFAHLVYVSSWLKYHYPQVFACGLLNAQPMGFYAPAQIVRDAREHGVEIRAVDINRSGWDNSLEPVMDKPGLRAVRLGFRQIKGMKEDEARKIERATDGAPQEVAFDSVESLYRKAGIRLETVECLAVADAFRSLGLDRRAALWHAKALPRSEALPLFAHADAGELGIEAEATLPEMALAEHVVEDYQSLRLSLKAHPMHFLRQEFKARKVLSTAELRETADGRQATVAGLVLVRQRPGSARGVVFLTMEDEMGVANAIVWPKVMERFRKEVMAARLIVIHGRVQRQEDIIHLVAERIEDASPKLLRLSEDAETLELELSRADEIKHPSNDDIRSRGQKRMIENVQHRRLKPHLPARHPRDVRDLVPRSRDFR